MMNRAVGGQNDRPARRERQAHQTRSCDRQGRFTGRIDLDDAAFAREGGSQVKLTFRVERDALRPAQTAEKSRHVALRRDFVDAIETGSGWPGYEQISVRTE